MKSNGIEKEKCSRHPHLVNPVGVWSGNKDVIILALLRLPTWLALSDHGLVQ